MRCSRLRKSESSSRTLASMDWPSIGSAVRRPRSRSSPRMRGTPTRHQLSACRWYGVIATASGASGYLARPIARSRRSLICRHWSARVNAGPLISTSVEPPIGWKADGLIVARGCGHVLVATGGKHNRVGNIKPALVVIERCAHAAAIRTINHERDPEDRPRVLIDAREIGEKHLAVAHIALSPQGQALYCR